MITPETLAIQNSLQNYTVKQLETVPQCSPLPLTIIISIARGKTTEQICQPALPIVWLLRCETYRLGIVASLGVALPEVLNKLE